MTVSLLNTQREVGLRDYLRLLKRHRWLIFSIFALITLTGTIWTFVQVPIYQAGATVLIEPELPKVLNIQDVTPMGSSGTDYYQTQY